MALQHLRASTADKRPTPAAMADGQLAMNTNLASPGLFFKDSNGDLVKAGPVHVGTTAPNVSPASGGQAGNSKGELWLDTTGSDYTLKTWDGSAWREIVVTSTMIKDGTIVNADVNASAAIAGTKVSPDFGSQTIATTGVFSHALGAVGTPSITFTGDLNTGFWSPAADTLAASTGGSERLRILSDGKVGLGTSSPGETLDVVGNIRSYSSQFQLNKPADFAGLIVSHGTYLDNTTKGGVLLRGGHGDGGSLNAWAIYARRDSTGGSTAAATLTFAHVTQNTGAETPRMTIDQSGRVGIGTTSPTSELHVVGANPSIYLQPTADTQTSELGFRNAADSQTRGFVAYSHTDDALLFRTNATERMRIMSVGTTNLFTSTTDVLVSRSANAAGTTNFIFRGTRNATGTTDGTVSIQIYTNGNVQNTNNSYGAISDIKLKENIVDAGSQWNDLKSLQVRKYNLKEGQTHTQIGLVAQEAELVSPGLVYETPDRDEEGNETGDVTKGINYSVLYMKAVKALQEAMERIETLEAKVAALEAQ